MPNAVTVITGAAGALGSGLARYLLTRDEKVALVDRPEAKPALDALASEYPGRALGLAVDVSSTAAWQQALPIIHAELGRPTGAALIAGGFRGGRYFYESNGDTWSEMLSRNLITTEVSLQAMVTELIKAGGGSIVVIGARPAVRPWEGAKMAEYTTSKAAVVALAQAVASEVVEERVRVNAVLPSTLDTPANRAANPSTDFTRWVTVDSMSGVIAFLLSDAARDISGATIPVYGRV
jgi:NAD(P)-dependent dehydrogenase (short-subunit alcohol dehydrogenase family)